LVVATLRNAKRYVDPSMKVVAGPSAASCSADVVESPDSPTKEVSTKLRRGPATHSAKHGKANLRNAAMVGGAGKGGSLLIVCLLALALALSLSLALALAPPLGTLSFAMISSAASSPVPAAAVVVLATTIMDAARFAFADDAREEFGMNASVTAECVESMQQRVSATANRLQIRLCTALIVIILSRLYFRHTNRL
jgi:hypothetical protein